MKRSEGCECYETLCECCETLCCVFVIDIQLSHTSKWAVGTAIWAAERQARPAVPTAVAHSFPKTYTMITRALQPYLPGDELYHMIIDLSDGSVELSYAKVKHSDELS